MLSYQQPENIRTISDPPHPACPSCGTEKGYALADGRVKCAACRKVFTPVYKTCRLDREQMATLTKSFWEMRSATETAEQLDLNIKTVQRYFHQLRTNIELHCTQLTVKQYGSATISESIFKEQQSRARLGPTAKPMAAIMVTATTVAILPLGPASPGPVNNFYDQQPNGWLYAKDNESLQRSQIDHIHCLASETDYISLILPFWQYAKNGLNRYQGGFRHHFPLFLREMEFRYNNRNNPHGAKLCLDLLTDSTN
jgi:transposase